MIAFPASVHVWRAVGRTDLRRGMNGLALQVQQALGRDPHAGDLYVFRGARGDLLKILWHDGIAMSLYAKWHGRTIRGTARLLLDGIDWRNPRHTFRPSSTG
jgi:transposase